LDGLWGRGACAVALVEVALDLSVRTSEDAHTLTQSIKEHLVQPFRRCVPMGECGGTQYSTRRRWRCTTCVVYGDRRSKLTGQWCCHVEYRFKGSDVVRKQLEVERPADLLHVGLRDFWKDRLLLEDFDLSKLGRMALHRGNAKRPKVKWFGRLKYDYDLRAGVIVARIAAAEINSPTFPSAQALRALNRLMPGMRPDRVLTPIDPSPLLPPDNYAVRPPPTKSLPLR
jgi:hypothetical protein